MRKEERILFILNRVFAQRFGSSPRSVVVLRKILCRWKKSEIFWWETWLGFYMAEHPSRQLGSASGSKSVGESVEIGMVITKSMKASRCGTIA